MADHGWLWLNDNLSDAKIRLVCMKSLGRADGMELRQPSVRSIAAGDSQTPGPIVNKQTTDIKGTYDGKAARTEPLGAKALEGSQEQEVLMELPAHAVVLASTSGYWKARLLRWRNCTASRTETVAVKLKVNTHKAATDQAASIKEQTEVVVRLIVQPEVVPNILQEHIHAADDVEAAQCTLRHAYTNKLPADATFPLLIQMAVYADRWDMPHALKASLSQVAAMKDLTVDNINALLHDQLPSTIKAQASFKTITNNCASSLMKLFGRAQLVVTQPACLKSFCSLSINAVQLWAQQEELMVDSENTVAVLFTHWWDSNSSNLSKQQARSACRTLTSSLRAGQVTASYLACTLDKLPWFKPTEQELSALRMMHGTDLSAITRGTVVSCQEIGPRPHANRTHKRYRQAMPKSVGDAAFPPLVPATFDLSINSNDGSGGASYKACSFGKNWPMSKGLCGCDELLRVEATSEPRTNSYPPDSLWKDGKLQLQFKMKEVW